MKLQLENECHDEVRTYAGNDYVYTELMEAAPVDGKGFAEISLKLNPRDIAKLANDETVDETVTFALSMRQAAVLGQFLTEVSKHYVATGIEASSS